MKKIKKAYTLAELLIMVTIFAILTVATIYLLKPAEQFSKARDSKRRNDLNEIRKIFEDWRSDTGCYPKKEEVCYNELTVGTVHMCEICTSSTFSPSLSRYTTTTLCDPEPTLRNYLYQPQGDQDCPSAYVVYTKLAATYNPSTDVWKCGPAHGCGPRGIYGYDYLVSSPNAKIGKQSNYICYTRQNECTGCGTIESCEDAIAREACIAYYANTDVCCDANPGATGDCN